MSAERVCHRWLEVVLPWMHQTRRTALAAVVSSACSGGVLSVTGLGRGIVGMARPKHSIKRADRLLSNAHLLEDLQRVYEAMSSYILGGKQRPIILVDWSDVDGRCDYYLLRAAVAVQGRSLTLYEEVHTGATKERPATHSAFLARLQEILRADCRPIIVTDAGFRTPWFRQVTALGWDYVGRVRNRDKVQLDEESAWVGVKTLHQQATRRAKALKDVLLTQSKKHRCSLVLFKAPSKNRTHTTKMTKQKARSRRSLVNAARGREPWVLATSLPIPFGAAKKIVSIYATRMQIEESFRDLKCPRFGLGLYQNNTYKLGRMQVLIMIGSLATNFGWLLGNAARLAKVHRRYQANTTTSTHVLSCVFVGFQLMRDKYVQLSWRLFAAARAHQRALVLTYTPPING